MKKNRSIQWNQHLSTGENARRELPLISAEFFRTGHTAALPGAAPVQLHAFRLASKRFRYTLEIFRPLYGTGLEAKLEQVRKVQSILGDRQDCQVLAARLRTLESTPAAEPELLARVEEKGRALEEKFRHHWQESFCAPGAEAAWTRYFSRGPLRSQPRQGLKMPVPAVPVGG